MFRVADERVVLSPCGSEVVLFPSDWLQVTYWKPQTGIGGINMVTFPTEVGSSVHMHELLFLSLSSMCRKRILYINM